MSLCKTIDTEAGHVWPHGYNLTILEEVYWIKLHTKLKIPGPSGFRKEDFSLFESMSSNLLQGHIGLHKFFKDD